jgi:hypothetical protein
MTKHDFRKTFRYNAVAFNGATFRKHKRTTEKEKRIGAVLYSSKSQHHARSADY